MDRRGTVASDLVSLVHHRSLVFEHRGCIGIIQNMIEANEQNKFTGGYFVFIRDNDRNAATKCVRIIRSDREV